MAEENAGKVLMTIELEQKTFQKALNSVLKDTIKQTNKATAQMSSSLTSAFSTVGKYIAAAFSIRQIVNFTKECIELGSSIAEIQNIVDVVYGDASSKVDELSKSMLKAYGLTEKATKQYMGFYGALASNSGFNDEESYEIAETLTKLTGDMASFYDISTDEAYNKVKGIFGGRIQGLKQLGIMLNESSLQDQLNAKGIDKSVRNMSEHEKIITRYNSLLEQTNFVMGDFTRTSNTWANQMRIVSGTWEQIKSNVGQGLINMLKPALTTINELLSKVLYLSQVFLEWTEKTFGHADTSSTGSVFSTLSSEAESASDDVQESVKDMKKSVMGFDELNRLKDNSTDDSTDTSGTDIDVSPYLSTLSTETSQVETEAEGAVKKARTILYGGAGALIGGFIGSFFGPGGIVVGTIVGGCIGVIIAKIQDIFEILKEHGFDVKKILNVLKEAVKTFLGFICAQFILVFENIVSSFKLAIKIVVSVIKFIWDIIMSFVNLFVNLFKDTKEFIKEFLEAKDAKERLVAFLKWVCHIFEDLFQFFFDLTDSIGNLFINIINSVINFLIDKLNSAISLINNAVRALSGLASAISGGKWDLSGFNIDYVDSYYIPEIKTKIPKLATGGYVSANTPQLAMIGDNKREGEIVAPESKITEAVAAAIAPLISALTGTQNNKGGDTIIPIYLDGNMLDQVIVKANKKQSLRTGGRA